MSSSQAAPGHRDRSSADQILPWNSFAFLQVAFARNQRVILYCALGLIAVGIELATYWVLANKVGFHHQSANLLATLCGITTSFCLNAAYTFKVRDRLWLRALSFFAVGMVGLGLTAITLYLLVDRLGIDKNWAKLLSAWVVVVQYNLNRLVSFR